MTNSASPTGETPFNRRTSLGTPKGHAVPMNPPEGRAGFWLALSIVVVFALLAVATTLSILALPTDGWQIPYNQNPPPMLGHFAGDWPTPLRAGDRVLAAAGSPVGGGEAPAPRASADWQTGKSVTYTILRGGQRQEIPVTLHRLDARGVLRSLWATVRDTPAEWSWSLVAILVFFLRPRSSAAQLMFLAFVPNNITTKLVWAATTISHNFAPAPVFYSYQLLNDFWGFLFYPAIILLALSFPQRVFPLTRWPRGLPILLFSASLGLSLIVTFTASNLLAGAILVADAVLLILAFGSALINSRRLSGNAEARAQAVWVFFGLGVSIISTLVAYLLSASGIMDLSKIDWVYSYLITLSLPLCLAIAITRYHLFDVYVIIRRTIQYTVLTLLLALVYAGGVVLLQSFFRAVAGFNSTGQFRNLSIVLSTLAIAALFTPLRRRVQNFIDRRFFRSKYDAQRILAGFSAATRQEVEFETLTASLIRVVEETIQPEQASLWMKRR